MWGRVQTALKRANGKPYANTPLDLKCAKKEGGKTRQNKTVSTLYMDANKSTTIELLVRSTCMERNCNCLGRNTKHFFGATPSFDVVYVLLSALCRIDPCCMWNVVVVGVLATFWLYQHCMTVLHTQRSYKRAHKFVLHSSDQVSNPGIELPSLAEGIYQSRFVNLLVGSSGTLGFVSRAPPKCNENERQGPRDSPYQNWAHPSKASVWIVWMVLAANPWGEKKAAKSLGLGSFLPEQTINIVSSLWFVMVKNKRHQIIHPLVVCSQDHVLYCVF